MGRRRNGPAHIVPSLLENGRDTINQDETGTYTDLDALKAKLQDRTATAAVIGLGYAGRRLALEIASSGFKVVGSIPNRKRLRCSNQANLTSETLLATRLLLQ